MKAFSYHNDNFKYSMSIEQSIRNNRMMDSGTATLGPTLRPRVIYVDETSNRYGTIQNSGLVKWLFLLNS